jgi:hypothetical protein
MLSSIHPLGERARGNRWSMTVSAFTVGAVGGGAVLGALAGTLGHVILRGPAPAWLVGALLVAAGVADLARVPAPSSHRQVNERWIGTYRGWVYGLGFGAQLGFGFATFVVTWGTPALALALAFMARPVAGVVVGAVFGAARAIPVLAAGWIDRPARLAEFGERMSRWAGPARLGGAAVLIIAGIGLVV